jgi:hypothetical protein
MSYRAPPHKVYRGPPKWLNSMSVGDSATGLSYLHRLPLFCFSQRSRNFCYLLTVAVKMGITNIGGTMTLKEKVEECIREVVDFPKEEIISFLEKEGYAEAEKISIDEETMFLYGMQCAWELVLNLQEKTMRLYDKTTGAEIKVGDIVETFRGERVELLGFRAPTHEGSTGRVDVQVVGTQIRSEYFPSVINAEIRGKYE